MKTRAMVMVGMIGLLVVGLFSAGMLTGSSMAQGSGGQDGGQDADDSKVIVKEIEIEGGEGPGVGFPFESALRGMAAAGELTTADVDAIMSDLSERTEAVSYSSGLSADGSEQSVLVDITIRSDETEELRAAMEAALEKALADGRITPDQKTAVLAEVDAAPDPLTVPAGGIVHVESLGLDGPELTAIVQERLDEAIAAGSVSDEEAAVFLDVLARLLAE